jgi:DNA-binding FadR family transcriptional regulator
MSGDTLPDNGLVDEADVSRTVVREAIKVLAAKGLVESRPKVGTRVRPRRDWNLLDPDVLAWQIEAGPDALFLEQALELRRMIEPAAARLAAERATDAEIAALYEAYEEMAAAGDDLDAFMGPDLRFHSLLLEACGNELLEHMSEIFTVVLRTVFAYSSSSSRSYPPRRPAAPGDREGNRGRRPGRRRTGRSPADRRHEAQRRLGAAQQLTPVAPRL